MADSFGTHSYGSKLYYGAYATANPTTAPPGGFTSFTEIAEVISLNGVPLSRPVTRLTHLNSDDRAHEKIPGILDGGQITAQLNMTRSQALVLNGLISSTVNGANDHNRYKFVVYIPIGAGYALVCKGFVAGRPITVPDDDRVTIDVTIEVSGRPVEIHFG